MTKDDKRTIDISKTIETAQIPENKVASKREGALSNIKPKVSEEELKNNLPAIRLIVEEKYRLEEDIKRLNDFKDKYYNEKEKCSVLNEKLNTINSRVILTTTGGILVGFLPTVWGWNNIGLFVAVSITSLAFLLVGFFKK